jgi:hypothetical protein
MNNMRSSKLRGILAVTLSILCLLLITTAANAQALKTTITDILSNPDPYDGKMVQVEGKVSLLKVKVSKKGNPYYTLKLAEGGKSLSVFNFGEPSIKEGDSTKVMGRYQKVKRVGRFTFYNEIDASGGSVEEIGGQNKANEQNMEEKKADEREWQR